MDGPKEAIAQLEAFKKALINDHLFLFGSGLSSLEGHVSYTKAQDIDGRSVVEINTFEDLRFAAAKELRALQEKLDNMKVYECLYEYTAHKESTGE
ncbi:MAG: hypothetical protein ACRCZZ_04740 [Phocaeicola sp.]